MSDMLGIASNAIGAYQRALSTVSNNIANVNTEGYSRQDVVLKDSAPKKMASMYIGTGVMLQNIKRQYDEFAESNLRNSNSDLSAQTPMVDYTKRVMDIMGDKRIGLNTALDDFFNAAGTLSADPASTVLRTSFLRSAEGVASRFAELSGQLDLIAKETSEGLKSVAAKINTLTNQLALINQSMSRSPTLDGQPPELLDRRDLTLRQLSELVRIKINFSTNGSASVSLGSTFTQGVVVDGQKARPIGVDPNSANSTNLLLDPYGNSEPLSVISGGEMGGYQTFITQVLEPSQKSLNALAKTFVDETNAVQKNGIDAYGQMGQNLYAISGSAAQQAAGIQLAITDGKRISTAAQFRVSEGNSNVTTTRATVKFDGRQNTTALSNTKLVNNPHPSAGVSVKVEGNREFSSVTSLSAGVTATFYMDGMEAGQNLQVLTRDGRQLLGQSLTETQKYQMLSQNNGFESNATYNTDYLNQIDPKAYRDLEYFYGAKAEILYKQNYDRNGAQGASLPLPASLETSRIESVNFEIPADALTLNNIGMERFTPIQGTEVLLQGVKLGDPPSSFDFNGIVGGKKITGVNIDGANISSLSELAAALNDELQDYGLTATLTNNDQDILIGDNQGRNISGIQLTPLAANGNGGQIKVSSPASQIAKWINGKTQLSIDAANFSGISFSLGGIPYEKSGLDSSQPDTMILAMQQDLRDFFNDNDITVSYENGKVLIVDEQGRKLDNLVLTPTTKEANPGIIDLQQSTKTQTNVYAEVVSQVLVPLNQLRYDKPLTLNGQVITGYDSAKSLAQAINDAMAGLNASITVNGELLIEDKQGASIDVGINEDGNALGINAGIYGAQVKMSQIYRDFKVSAAAVDFTKPLAVNGYVLNEVAYDLPASDVDYTIDSVLPSLSVSGSDATTLAAALNAEKDFAAQFKATVSPDGTRMFIRPHEPTLNDEDLSRRFNVSLGVDRLLPQTTLSNVDDLVVRINSRYEDTGVVASLDLNGDLILSTTDVAGRGPLSIGPGKDSKGQYAPNMLGLEPLDYNVTRRIQSSLTDESFTVDPYKTDIRLSFGAYSEGNPPVTHYGDPYQLAKLGLRTAAYIQSSSPDDLLVFVTGKGQCSVSVGYEGEPANNRDLLRSQSLAVKFTAEDRYNIIDVTTGSVLADRLFDPSALEPQIEFQGLVLTLSTAPKVGDAFKIDGNFDGLGNNVNILDMVDLGKRPLENGKTIRDTYIDQVNDVGNLSQQAQITQEALKVVNEQALQSRDKVSGVNMDEEAAALVRYQQAYQAAAKALQVSGQLFDAIVQIR